MKISIAADFKVIGGGIGNPPKASMAACSERFSNLCARFRGDRAA